MPNLGKKISAHNRSVLQQPQAKPTKTCNCRTPSSCPLSGECLTDSVVYQATVKSEGREETYIGLTGDQFKSRYRNHMASFRNSAKRNATELSKHVWELKDKGAEFTLSWKIIARARMYANTTKRCNLCLTEKFFIICRPQLCILNRRNELASACQHATKYLLKNT